MNRIAIIHSTGQLGNKLWLYTSVYAYCLEKGYICDNYDFDRSNNKYSRYFEIVFPEAPINIILFQKYLKVQTKYPLFKIFKKLLALVFLRGKMLVEAEQADSIFYLPPHVNNNSAQKKIIDEIDSSSNTTFYFSGFFFGNIEGAKKYRKEIINLLKPKEQYLKEIDLFLSPIREKYKLLVGVHLRLEENQKIFENGHTYTFEEFRSVLEDFLDNLKQLTKEDIVFIVCSDMKFDPREFESFNTISGPGGIITDMYSLAMCDLIIGSNSTYGGWASYYGGIPHIRFSTEKIDWGRMLSGIKI